MEGKVDAMKSVVISRMNWPRSDGVIWLMLRIVESSLAQQCVQIMGGLVIFF